MQFGKILALAASGSMVFGSVVAQASTLPSQASLYAPLFTTSALATPAAANPCVAGMQGCVLPLKTPPAPEPAPTPAPTPAPAPVAAPVAESSGGIGFLPILAAIAAVAGGIILLTDDDDDDDEPLSP